MVTAFIKQQNRVSDGAEVFVLCRDGSSGDGASGADDRVECTQSFACGKVCQ